ncbi:dTMP kinase [Aeriscardovia aeriphila]|uniref:Thymidylate kinase n=1 Tax=Aeriscardovia aeriphila TaxID=218139 RepID=A0A261F816_9BIFI|nr:thymidylate kinase [Aeriscardovia aeriphila]
MAEENNVSAATSEPSGLFLTFEGIDGVGKTTQVNMLAQWIREEYGREVVTTFEPGDTALGRAIRTLLLNPEHTAAAVSPRAEALLYAADRAQHVHEVIAPALNRGAVVISDRYIDSSLAYQAGGRELSSNQILAMSQLATGNLWPSRTYLLDMSVEESHRRVALIRGEQPDRLEAEKESFHQRTREAFLSLAAAHPERFCVIDASQTIGQIHNELCGDVRKLLSPTR